MRAYSNIPLMTPVAGSRIHPLPPPSLGQVLLNDMTGILTESVDDNTMTIKRLAALDMNQVDGATATVTKMVPHPVCANTFAVKVRVLECFDAFGQSLHLWFKSSALVACNDNGVPRSQDPLDRHDPGLFAGIPPPPPRRSHRLISPLPQIYTPLEVRSNSN